MTKSAFATRSQDVAAPVADDRTAAQVESPLRRTVASATAVARADDAARDVVQRLRGPDAPPPPAPSGLVVGAADDPAEKEADRVAAQVVAGLRSRSAAGAAPPPGGGDGTPTVRRSGPVVRRLMSVKDFKDITYQRFAKRGEALKILDEWIPEYEDLGALKPTVANSRKREQLLLQMKYATEAWIADHVIDLQDGTGVSEDPKRVERLEGMRLFKDSIDLELASVRRALAQRKEAANDEVNVETAKPGYKRLKQKYEGDATSTLDKVAWMIDLAAPNDGDEAELEIEFRWPVDPTGIAFVGGRLKINAMRDAPVGSVAGNEDKAGNGGVVIRAELAVTGGAQWLNTGEAKAELGIYFESSARSARECTTLVSYALYRRWRESYVLPDGAANFIWGGRTGSFGKKKAEKWSQNVETSILGDRQKKDAQGNPITDVGDAYVETGMFGGVSGRIGVGDVAEIGGGISFSGGTRYDKESVEAAKGKVGANNKKAADAVLSNAQASLGRSAYVLDIGFDASGGVFSGTAGIKAKWLGEGPKKSGMKTQVDSVELTGSFKTAVPNVGHEDGLNQLIRYIVPGLVTVISTIRRSIETHKQRMLEAANKSPEQSPEGHKAKWSGQVLGMVENGVPILSQVKQLGDVTKLVEPADKLVMGTPKVGSTAGLVAAIGWDVLGGDVQLSLNFEKDIEFQLPAILKVTAKKSERIISFKWNKQEKPQGGESTYKFSVA